jgi:hypothetical protein
MIRQQVKGIYDVPCQALQSYSESVHLDPAESAHHLASASRAPISEWGRYVNRLCYHVRMGSL